MAKLMFNQKWFNINQYPLDYYEFLYQYYSAFGVRTPVTYYSLDLSNSVYDGDLLDGGTYEQMGNLSGLLWKKINMLPVYQLEQLNFAMNADESGVYYPNLATSFYLPASYELRPRVHDFMVYEQISERDDPFKASLPMYEVVNVEKATSADVTFWKVVLNNTSRSKRDIEDQLSGNFTFVDFEKQIYPTSDAILLQKFILKNSNLKVNDFWKQHIGLYAETLDASISC